MDNNLIGYIPAEYRREVIDKFIYYQKSIDYAYEMKEYVIDKETMLLLLQLSLFAKYVIVPLKDLVKMYERMSSKYDISSIKSGKTNITAQSITSIRELITDFTNMFYEFGLRLDRGLEFESLVFEDIEAFLSIWLKQN